MKSTGLLGPIEASWAETWPSLALSQAGSNVGQAWVQLGLKGNLRTFGRKLGLRCATFFLVCVCGGFCAEVVGPALPVTLDPKLKPGSAHVGPRQARSDATWSCFFGLWSINSCLLLAAS